jgi:hypothetical protein
MPAWSKFRFSKERARWPSITGYVPIPVQNRTSISLDLAYSSIEETTGTSGTIAQIMRWAAPTSESFRDWYTSDDAGSGTDAEAYLVTGYMTGGDSARNKFLPWLTIHCSREGLRGEVASESATASTTPTATVTDSFSTNLILLIHANTADVMGQDHSGWNHPIQRIGSTSYETTLFKYGNGSYHFGSASYSSVVTLSSNHKPSYGLAWPQHSVMNSMCGQNKFTIEWWSYRTVPASLPTSKAYPPVSGGIGALVDRYNA